MIASAISEQRRAKGLTQAQVAKAMGRHQPFIANIESGERRVDLVELLDIAAMIEMDVEALIHRLRVHADPLLEEDPLLKEDWWYR